MDACLCGGDPETEQVERREGVDLWAKGGRGLRMEEMRKGKTMKSKVSSNVTFKVGNSHDMNNPDPKLPHEESHAMQNGYHLYPETRS
jgi:hypothetical protein